MVRAEINLFLKNAPGELGKLASMISGAGVNIDALTIQDASDYMRELFRARGRSLKRIAPLASYSPMQKDSVEYGLIRLLVDQTDKTIDLLSKEGYTFDIMLVIALSIDNKPGALAGMIKKFSEEEININYVYGSALPGDEKSLIVFSPEDIDLAATIFKD